MQAGGEENLMREQDFMGLWAYNEPGIVPGRYLAAWGKMQLIAKELKKNRCSAGMRMRKPCQSWSTVVCPK